MFRSQPVHFVKSCSYRNGLLLLLLLLLLPHSPKLLVDDGEQKGGKTQELN